MSRQHIVLEPRDGWFLQTATGWRPSGAGVSRSHRWPLPGTLTGCLRTGWGLRQQGAERWSQDQWRAALDVHLGPSFAVRRLVGTRSLKPEDRMWPVPQDALFLEADDQGQPARVVALDPRHPAEVLAARPDPRLDALWWAEAPDRAKPAPRPAWWTEAELVQWLLKNEASPVHRKELAQREPSVRRETHVSIERTTWTASDGALFGNEVVEPLVQADGATWSWSIAAAVELPAGKIEGAVGLGADRRMLQVQEAGAGLFEAPKALRDVEPTTWLRVIAATPAELADGWLPPGFHLEDGALRGKLGPHAVTLRGALIDRPLHISGWDMERNGPKPVRRLCPAGSVWFLQAERALTGADLAALWLTAWGEHLEEGQGRLIVAPWHHPNPGELIMDTRPFLLHALTPLHAGTGQAQDLVDLPIARTKAMNLPYVPGSSIKGVLREELATEGAADIKRIFGPDRHNASDNAGAVVVGDARLLAMPVRSFRGTFAWVTSPLLLQLAARDLGSKLAIPRVAGGPRAAHGAGCLNVHAGKVYLEDIDLTASEDREAAAWGAWLAGQLYPSSPATVSGRFLVVDDETMTFLTETATQVDARVSIDRETGTARDGALWLEESLPAESVLVGLMAVQRLPQVKPAEVLDAVCARRALQLGGKSTVGRGRCLLLPGGV